MTGDGVVVCDSQVHAPDLPHDTHTGGIDPDMLLREMAGAGVDRCVVVPPAAPGDVSANNGPALDMAHRYPGSFVVMGRFDLTRPDRAGLLARWTEPEAMAGVRVSFVRDPNRSLLRRGELGWFWAAAEEAAVPVMVLVPNDLVPLVGVVAGAYPGLPLAIDHLGLTPYEVYEDLRPAIAPLLRLAHHGNLAVKASALPDSVREPFPFPTLHEPIRQVVESFGARRVFWGSDLTRLRCPYAECVRLFSEELAFLTGKDRELVLGRAVMDWLGWTPAGPADEKGEDDERN